MCGQNILKQLGVSKVLNGREDSQANSVVHLIKKWNLAEQIKFMSLNKTASNTGVRSGACKII